MKNGIPAYNEAEKQVCRKICRFNSKLTHCIGCNRSMEEINEWHTYSKNKRKHIIKQLVKRKIND